MSHFIVACTSLCYIHALSGSNSFTVSIIFSIDVTDIRLVIECDVSIPRYAMCHLVSRDWHITYLSDTSSVFLTMPWKTSCIFHTWYSVAFFHFSNTWYSQGACEEVPHGHKGKIELFTISSFLHWGTNNNSSWDVGKDEWKTDFMERWGN